MSKTYAIADTHGRFDLLSDAISAAERYAGTEGGTLIVLGDFVDRGPASRSIIELLMAGPSLPNWRWIVLQGNHEAMMLECLTNPGILRWWVGNGGGATLRSYGYQHGDGLVPLKIPVGHLEWLADLPVTHEDDHRIYVHAGVPFDQDVAAAKRDTLQWMLYASEQHYEDATVLPDAGHVSGKHVVHGHEQSASHPLLKPHRTNLDTFAWSTGRLAVGVFDDAMSGGPVDVLWAEGARG
jgi:serine/threonine protein phosphatase 1